MSRSRGPLYSWAPEVSSRKASCRAGDGILESTGYHVPLGAMRRECFVERRVTGTTCPMSQDVFRS